MTIKYKKNTLYIINNLKYVIICAQKQKIRQRLSTVIIFSMILWIIYFNFTWNCSEFFL